MVKLTIDNKELQVREGTKLIDGAREHGIPIPSLCYKKELPHYTSCMLCLVKDNLTNKFIPACSARVEEGMNIDASGPEVISLRKEALSLLLTEHRAECEAPCRVVCPVGLNIPLMNRHIQQGNYVQASRLIFHEMGLPETLCSVCPKYCEKACRRKMIDAPVAITHVKNFITRSVLPGPDIRPAGKKSKIAVIGAGASGLTVAFHLAKQGHHCTLFEESDRIGGTLITELTERGFPVDLLDREMDHLVNTGIDIRLNCRIERTDLENDLAPVFDVIINASPTSFESDHITPAEKYIQSEGDTRVAAGKYLFDTGYSARTDKQIIRRIGHAKNIAVVIHDFLQVGNLSGVKRRFNSTIGKIDEDEKGEWVKECPEGTHRFPEPSSNEECTGEAFNCMHCDCRALDNCSLRDLSESFHISNPKGKLVSHPVEKKINQTNKLIFENAKCIKCGLCVRVSTDSTDNPSLCFTGRGFMSLISEPLTSDFHSILPEGVEEVINACPTGALARKE